MTEQETLCMMALTRVPGIGLPGLRLLLEQAGSATVIYEHRRHIRDVMPELHPRAVEGISLMDTLMGRAEEEYRFASQSRIRCLGFYDDDYPARLRECSDAPILLYFRGTADLNARRVVSMVGTRKITPYGRDLCARFVADLRALSPDTLVVSGLAYGVDIHCHRAALAQGLPTVGVLAHGMDQIYPRMHRTDAVKMLEQGGLLTAGIAGAYDRDVFAFPGRVGDAYSEGCNNLIRTNRAELLTSAEDFLQSMGWETDAARQKQLAQGVQQDLFPSLSAEERVVVDALRGSEGMQMNVLTVRTGISIGQLSSLLFGLEMQGVVRTLSGGVYRLI